MRLFFYFFLFLLIPISVYGASFSELFNGWACSNYYTSMDKTNFSVFVDSQQVMVDYPNHPMIVKIDDCKSNNGFTACVNNLHKGECNVSGVIKWVNVVNLTVKKETPEIIIEKKIESDVLLNKPFHLIVQFKNDGKVNANNFSYSEAFPIEIFDIISSTCPSSENKVSWNGILKSGQDFQCDIQLFPKKVYTYHSKGFIQYFNGINLIKKTSSKTILIHSHGISLLPMTSANSIKIGQNLLYHLEMSIGKQMKIDSLKILLPSNFVVSNVSKNLTFTNGEYEWKGTLNDTIGFDLNITPFFIGEQKIKAIVNYEIEGLNPVLEKEVSINVSGVKLGIQVYSNVSHGHASFYIVNLGKYKFENITYNYSLENKTFSSDFKELLPLSSKEVSFNLNKTEIIPVHLNYYSKFGQKLEDNFSVKIYGPAHPKTNKTVKIVKKNTSSKIKKTPLAVKKKGNNYSLWIIAGGLSLVIVFFLVFMKNKLK